MSNCPFLLQSLRYPSIAQTLVEQLDGRITAESTLGQGSTFIVWLPLAVENQGDRKDLPYM
jgi:signal transduction histidine kinase